MEESKLSQKSIKDVNKPKTYANKIVKFSRVNNNLKSNLKSETVKYNSNKQGVQKFNKTFNKFYSLKTSPKKNLQNPIDVIQSMKTTPKNEYVERIRPKSEQKNKSLNFAAVLTNDRINTDCQKRKNTDPKCLSIKSENEIRLNEGSLSTEASNHFRGRLEDYAIGKEIGKGAYAIVKQALHKPTNRKVAIKIYEKVKLLDSQRKNSVKREISILKRIDNQYIVKLVEMIDNSKQVLIF